MNAPDRVTYLSWTGWLPPPSASTKNNGGRCSELGRARGRRKVASAKTVKAIGWRNNGLHVKSYRLIEGSTSPEGFPTRQERPRSGILDRHAPATIGGTEPLRGRPSGQATASTTPLWHAIPQRRCETIARTHTHGATNPRSTPCIPASHHSSRNPTGGPTRTGGQLGRSTRKGGRKEPLFGVPLENLLGGWAVGRRCSERASVWPSPGRTEGALIKCGRNHLSPARRTWTGAGRSV
ncbi:uncharacterized protein LOC120426057 [Culex pipiens pallens]|uniref:uncharacterized protein LOC120426057 n=1 Tax=Culex pipiens pallens TaxID=42434 RepID=UPI0022AA168E|nr:uncharacterized protein LOC120426057 [Culex pipiens pallens]